MAIAAVVQRELFPQLVNSELGWFASLDPTFPLLERWPPNHLPWTLYCLMDVPSHEEGVLGGTVNSHCMISCLRSLMSCRSSLSLRSPSWAWRRCSVSSHGGDWWGGVCGYPSPVVGFEHHIVVNVATCASIGAFVQTMMTSPWNSVMSSRVRCTRLTSLRLPNKMTNSTAEYWSTPNGQVCALLMQISMMSSSKMEEASIGVPSPLVMVINSNLFQNELGDGTSWSLNAVAEEVMDIVKGTSFYLFKILLCWSGSSRFTWIIYLCISYNITTCYLR